jgi:hypothetical protein
VTDVIFVGLGLLMLGGLLFLAGSMSHDDPRLRRSWDARFDREARELRPTDATGVLRCRRCGSSGSERSGVCPSCRAAL